MVEIDKLKYEIVFEEECFNVWVVKLEKVELIVFDIEIISFNYMDVELVGVLFCIEEGEVVYVFVVYDYLDVFV